MNRREMLLGVVATAVAAAVPAVEATATWRRIHDGKDFIFDGDFTINMWLRPIKQADRVVGFDVDDFSVRANTEEALRHFEAVGVEFGDSYEVIDCTIERYQHHVPQDGGWHHLYAHGGVVFVDGELVNRPDGVALMHYFGEASVMFDWTGDYAAVS